MKYLKVMDNIQSNANPKVVYKINEVNVAQNWNKNATTPEKMGGFNFSTEDRWLLKRNTIYEVIIPEGQKKSNVSHFLLHMEYLELIK